jgi:predicted flavoprotein YhiN
MESALCPGLFLAGELLDYSLPSGGFNIQAAASTGYLAGRQKIY